MLHPVFHSWKNLADQNSMGSSQIISDKESTRVLNDEASGGSQGKKKPRLSPGQTGLRNLGNTCFVNSCLQCLSHTQPFRRYFLNLSEKKGIQRRSTMDLAKEITVSLRKRKAESVAPEEHEQSLAVNTYNLLRVMWSANGKWPVVTPSAFLSSIWSTLPEYKGYLQHDALEFLWYVLFFSSSFVLDFLVPMFS